MAITSIGYRGTVDQTEWSKLLTAKVGLSDYGVTEYSKLVLSKGTGDRTIQISPGTFWGKGVLDTSTATETVTLPAVTSGSRYDLIVARREWNYTGAAATGSSGYGRTFFTRVAGTSARKLPARQTNGGTIDEQPLILARVDAGKTDVQEIIDLKCWASTGGVLIRDTMALDYLAGPGARVIHGTDEWEYTGKDWEKRNRHYSTGWVNGSYASGWSKGTNGYIMSRIAELPDGTKIGEVRVRATRTGADITSPSSGDIGNNHVGTVVSGHQPTSQVGLCTASTGPLRGVCLELDRRVMLTALVPGIHFKKGQEFAATAFYFL